MSETYACPRHPDRLSAPASCQVALMDPARTDDYVCACCAACRWLCAQLISDNGQPHECVFTLTFEGRQVCRVCGAPQA